MKKLYFFEKNEVKHLTNRMKYCILVVNKNKKILTLCQTISN